MSDDRPLIEQWRASPWTIKAYVLVSVVGVVVHTTLADDPFQGLGWLPITALLIWGLIRGARPAWIALLVLAALGVLSAIGLVVRADAMGTDGLEVFQHATVVVLFVLLLHSQTRAWCRRKLRLTDPDERVDRPLPRRRTESQTDASSFAADSDR